LQSQHYWYWRKSRKSKQQFRQLKYAETVDRFVKWQKGSSVLIFCDGSVCSGVVGSSACAAVLYPLLDSQQMIISTKAVGKKVSS